jgi:arylsulfatase A-like enzyme
MMCKTSIVACVLILLPLAAAAAEPARPAARRPNIVFIYGDDIGWGDFSCYGATAVQTPNIDRLANGGLRFTSAYATSATCTPSRFSLLTGEYAFRQKGTGILPGDAKLIIRPGRETLPAMLMRAGYRTAAIGKWHLGLGEGSEAINWNQEIKPGPGEIGFDYSFIMAATGDRVPCVYVEGHRVVGLDPSDPIEVSYKNPFPGEPTGQSARDTLTMDWSHGHADAIVHGISRIGFMKGGKSALWQDDDMAKVFTEKALAFIQREQAGPFFLYLAAQDIHVPRVPNEQFVGKTNMGPRGDAIVEFDWMVGQVAQTLEKLNLLDDTLIIVTSDNGPVLDDGYKDGAAQKVGDHKPAGPYRGGKYSMFEGGTRIPLIASWRGKVQPGTSDALLSQIDFLASLASLTGQTFNAADAPDTQDQLRALLGETKTGRDSLIEHASGLALRQGEWKYIPPGRTRESLSPGKNVRIPEPGFLFNLAKDPGETQDVAAKHPEKLKQLRELQEATTTGGAGLLRPTPTTAP